MNGDETMPVVPLVGRASGSAAFEPRGGVEEAPCVMGADVARRHPDGMARTGGDEAMVPDGADAMVDRDGNLVLGGVGEVGVGGGGEGGGAGVVPIETPRAAPAKRAMIDRLEAWISKAVARSPFWNRVCSRIWLPIAAKSGLRFHMPNPDQGIVSAVLPFTRFNRNWYDAMAGAALLANSEIAGGMYVYERCGGDYRVVCKELSYKFLRPCFGPAVYRIQPRADLAGLLATGRAFNLEMDMDIVQQITRRTTKEYRVGRCSAVFHVSPKAQHKTSKSREREAAQRGA